MFYENYRIVKKQAIYLNREAQDLIGNFKSKNMDENEIKAALEILLEDRDQTENQVDIVKTALTILKRRKAAI